MGGGGGIKWRAVVLDLGSLTRMGQSTEEARPEMRQKTTDHQLIGNGEVMGHRLGFIARDANDHESLVLLISG